MVSTDPAVARLRSSSCVAAMAGKSHDPCLIAKIKTATCKTTPGVVSTEPAETTPGVVIPDWPRSARRGDGNDSHKTTLFVVSCILNVSCSRLDSFRLSWRASRETNTRCSLLPILRARCRDTNAGRLRRSLAGRSTPISSRVSVTASMACLTRWLTASSSITRQPGSARARSTT